MPRSETPRSLVFSAVQVCPFGPSSTYIATQQQSGADFVLPTPISFKPASTASKLRLKVAVLNKVTTPRDTGVDLGIMSTGAGPPVSVVFRYKLHDMDTYFPPVTATGTTYTSLGSALELKTNKGKGTGIFVYFDLTGSAATEINAKDSFSFNVSYHNSDHFSPGDHNTAHQLQECSAQGKCQRSSGQCECERGFTGAACQRTVCENDCSGHGVCTPLKQVAAMASNVEYTAYDAMTSMGCVCDDGWSGPACTERQCPSKPDPMGGSGGTGIARDGSKGPALPCSGRGECFSGTCRCHHGFIGEACEEFTTLI